MSSISPLLRNLALWVSGLLFSSSLLPAQTLSDSVATLYAQYLSQQQTSEPTANQPDSVAILQELLDKLQAELARVESAQQQVNDSLSQVNQEYRNLSQQVGGLSSDLTSSLDQVRRLTEADLLSKEARLASKRLKIIKTAKFVKAAQASFDAVDAALTTSDYLNDVGQLNSPTNRDLGFSLDEEILEILDQTIIKGSKRFNNKEPDKFRQTVGMLIDNPLTTAVSNSVPALSAIRAVVDLVVGVSVREDEVEIDDIRQFKDSLSRYIQHYEDLARASYDFNANLDKLRVKTNALRSVLSNYTAARINTLRPEAIPPTDIPPLGDLIFMHYQYDQLSQVIDGVIAEYTIGSRLDVQGALDDPRLAYPLYAVTQAQFIHQELESITTQYVSAYALYHDRLREILRRSRPLSDEPEKVDAKLATLGEKLERLVEAFNRNVKIREVNRALQEIPTY